MSYRFLAAFVCVVAIANGAVVYCAALHYVRGTLTGRELFFSGMSFAALLGLFAAGVQTLVQGPAL